MKEKFNLLISDQFIKISLLLSLFFLVPLVILIIATFGNLPPLIPFFNSMPWGEDRLFSSRTIIFIPLLVLVIFTINLFFATAIYKKYALIARIILFNCFLFLLLSLLSYLQILFLTF